MKKHLSVLVIAGVISLSTSNIFALAEIHSIGKIPDQSDFTISSITQPSYIDMIINPKPQLGAPKFIVPSLSDLAKSELKFDFLNNGTKPFPIKPIPLDPKLLPGIRIPPLPPGVIPIPEPHRPPSI